MRNKKGIGLITLIIIIAVILVIGGVILFSVINKNLTDVGTDNNMQKDNNPNVGKLENPSKNTGEISYDSFKIMVGNGKKVGLGTSVKEFVEQTGIEVKDRTGEFDEEFTYSSGTWDDAKIWYNDYPIGDARIRNSHTEPKNYKDCELIYFGINNITEENMHFYYLNNRISNRSEVLKYMGEPYEERMMGILENAYVYKLSPGDISPAEISPATDLQLKIDFDENNDKIEKIYISL